MWPSRPSRKFNDTIYIADLKTTYEAIGSKYAERFTPDNQFTLYTLAGRVALGSPCSRSPPRRRPDRHQLRPLPALPRLPSPASPRRMASGLRWWTFLMEKCAGEAELSASPEEAYPQNDKACGLYGGCQFRETCGRCPMARKPIMDATFQIRRWDPVGQPR